jgi:hypothetical protein
MNTGSKKILEDQKKEIEAKNQARKKSIENKKKNEN